MKTFNYILLVFLLAAITSCKKDTIEAEPETSTPPSTTGTVKIEFKNMVDASPLVFNQYYLNPKNDSFKVSKFNYFISHVVLVKSDNSVYAEPASYHLVKHSTPSTCVLTINNVPEGSYKAVRFMLGVDSAANCSGTQPGDLAVSVASDMFWSWNTGYIMLKLEGSSPKSGATTKDLEYHIGGYGGQYKTQRNYDLGFGSSVASVSSSASPKINLNVNVNELFKSPTLIDVTTQYSQLGTGVNAKMYADNYADMITFLNIQ